MNDITLESVTPKKLFVHKPYELTVLHDTLNGVVILEAWPTGCGSRGELPLAGEEINVLLGVLAERGYAKTILRQGFKPFGRKKDVFFFTDPHLRAVFRFHLDRDERRELAQMLMPIVDPEIAHENLMAGKA